MASKPAEICSTSLVIKKMLIKKVKTYLKKRTMGYGSSARALA
jgi:hypothetical protein